MSYHLARQGPCEIPADAALAIEVYAKQAQNVELERQACEIRLRAQRKCGELLRDRDKAKRGPSTETGQGSQRARSDAQPLAELGISHDQSSRWQKLAAVPPDLFEQQLQAERPTTTAIIAAHEQPEPKDKVGTEAL